MVILFDMYNMSDDIFELIFATEQQVIVAKLLVEEMKLKEGELGKTEMSLFAMGLHDGRTVEYQDRSGPVPVRKKMKISYNKRQFYDRILTPLKSMGVIDYDLYKKTYKISEKFNKNMMRIGLMWLQELRKPPLAYNIARKQQQQNV